ncbi:hypothetical protein PInf_016335 [Phytophthora infestans]|nr:hypothetical protein PInf_016335 [Phytophthora infestans]
MDISEFPRLNDSQYESVRKMGDIFGQDILRSLAAATPAEQQECVTAFETYGRGLIAHVRGSLEASKAAPQAIRPSPVWWKVPAFEGKEGENLHFWVREVEIAMKAGLISDEPVRHWAYTRETTSPGCFASWAQLCEQLRAAFLPSNNVFRQRSRFLPCKQCKRELQEYAQEMCTLVASLAGNPLPEDVKTVVFTDGLKLFRVQATTMEEAIQIARQEEYSHKQAGTPRKEEHRHDEDGVPRKSEHRSNDAVAPAVTQTVDTGVYSEPEPMDLSSAELGPLLWMQRTWTLPACVVLGRGQPVDPKSGGTGPGQVDEDSPATNRQVAEASRSCQRADSSAYSKTMLCCGNATGVGLLPGVWTCYTSSVQRRRSSRRTGYDSGYVFKR